MIMKFFIGLLLSMLLGISQAALPKDPYEYFFHQSFGDLEEEIQSAEEEGKAAVFVFFEMDECRWCKKMKETILNQPEVQDWYREHFLNLVINVEGDVEINGFDGDAISEKRFAIISTARNKRDLARDEYRKPTPYFAFFDTKGNRLVTLPGMMKSTDEFLMLGQYVLDGAYKNMSFTRYKKKNKN